MTHPHFPRLGNAIAAFAASHDPRRGAQGPDYDLALEFYRQELLPLILGEEWSRSGSWVGKLVKSPMTNPLFDHPLIFRRRGAKGPTTWKSAIVIGRPYDALRGSSSFSPDAKQLATHLNEMGVVVWIRPDLSAWYPGRTQLVLAAPGLKSRTASNWGFVCIGDPCPEPPDAQ